VRSYLLLTVLASLVPLAACAADKPSKDEERVLQIIDKMGGDGSIDAKAEGKARVVARFDKLTDAQLASLKGATCLLGIEVVDAGKLSDRSADFLRTLPHLQRLSLNKPAITDRGLAALKSLTELRILYLGGAKIGDAGISSLKPLTSLEELDLYDTHVTDKSLALIEGFENLTSLNLAGTKVTDAAAKHLREMKNLKVLNLAMTEVSMPAIKSIEDAIPGIRVRR
jgi:Leucine Rich repeat